MALHGGVMCISTCLQGSRRVFGLSPSRGPGKLESGLMLGCFQSIAEVPWSKVMKPKGSESLSRSAEVL